MTGCWCLPMQAELGGVRYAIRPDYRDVLELLRWLGGSADPALDEWAKGYLMLEYNNIGAHAKRDQSIFDPAE